MDSRLEKALDFSNFRMILSTRQKNLKTLFENKLLVHYEGGLFKASQELLTFIYMLIDRQEESWIFIDLNDTPKLISNLPNFYEVIYEKLNKCSKEYYDSYKKLSEVREIRKAIDWDDKTL